MPKAPLICSWCGKRKGWTETTDGSPSHGIHKRCARRALAEAFDDDKYQHTARDIICLLVGLAVILAAMALEAILPALP